MSTVTAALLVSTLSVIAPPLHITVEPPALGRLMNQPSLALAAAALHLHREAQQHKRPDDYALARQLYERWLDEHASAAPREEPQMRFFYAELLWDLEEHDAAAEQYERVHALAPKGKRASRAAANELYALDKALSFVTSDERPSIRQRLATAAAQFSARYCRGKSTAARKADCDAAQAFVEAHAR